MAREKRRLLHEGGVQAILHGEDLRPKMEIYKSLSSPPELPALYRYGFPHNNCGGACVKAGLAQWQLVLTYFPERFKWHENMQLELMAENPKLKPFLRKTIKGKLYYITLQEFREKYANGPQPDDFGGCGCAI